MSVWQIFELSLFIFNSYHIGNLTGQKEKKGKRNTERAQEPITRCRWKRKLVFCKREKARSTYEASAAASSSPEVTLSLNAMRFVIQRSRSDSSGAMNMSGVIVRISWLSSHVVVTSVWHDEWQTNWHSENKYSIRNAKSTYGSTHACTRSQCCQPDRADRRSSSRASAHGTSW